MINIAENFNWVLNNKDFIKELSEKLGYTIKDTNKLVASTISIMTDSLIESDSVMISSFGLFDVKKKVERITINPNTKVRLLVPPKLVLTFHPSTMLKDKFK